MNFLIRIMTKSNKAFMDSLFIIITIFLLLSYLYNNTV